MPMFINIMYIYIIPLLLSCLFVFSQAIHIVFYNTRKHKNKHFLFPMVLRFFS